MRYFKLVLLSIILMTSTAQSDDKNYDFKRNETTFQLLGNDFISPVTEGHTRTILIGSSAIMLEALIFKNQNKKLVRNISKSKPLGQYSKDFELIGQVIPNIEEVRLIILYQILLFFHFIYFLHRLIYLYQFSKHDDFHRSFICKNKQAFP